MGESEAAVSSVNVVVRFTASCAMACLALGCAGPVGAPPGGRPDPPARGVDPRAVQAATMSFADRYIAAVADECDRAELAAATPQAAIMAQRLKIVAGNGAIANATDPHPVTGLMNMALLVKLTHEVARDGWVGEMFGPERAAALVAALEAQEADVWQTAAAYLTPAQVDELHQLAAEWRARNPDQRYVTGARLADFAQSKTPGGGGTQQLAGGAQQIAGSVFGLMTLDPFHGLDPALKEVEETRVLAERLFFYLRHTPVLVTWQADVLFDQMLAQPQVTQLFADTTTVAGSTTRFSDATSRFSDASNAVAQTVEKFRLQLPDQQAKLVAELDDLVARQRAAALAQAMTQVSVERDATLRQFADTVAAQQDLLTRNLKGVTDESIDRVYRRARSLVLVTVGSILLAFVLHRLFVGGRPTRA